MEGRKSLLNFQSVLVGTSEKGYTSKYLVYLAPPEDNSPDGHFVQEDGGMCWVSKKYPMGEPCDTRLIDKELGDRFLQSEDQSSDPKPLLSK